MHQSFYRIIRSLASKWSQLLVLQLDYAGDEILERNLDS